jgi:hypothetical protein
MAVIETLTVATGVRGCGIGGSSLHTVDLRLESLGRHVAVVARIATHADAIRFDETHASTSYQLQLFPPSIRRANVTVRS